jgi:hypothetical protein
MMDVSILFVALALFVGAAVAWFFREPEIAMLRVSNAEEKARADELMTQLSRSGCDFADLRAELAAANERAAALQHAEDRVRGLSCEVHRSGDQLANE